MTLLPGTLLGPYEVQAQIGSGGMGVVYKARDPRLHRDVAIKVIGPSYAQDEGRLMRRLEQEARAIAKISHPNILHVYDVGLHEGAPFVVMELLLGETLRQRLARGPLPARKVADIVIQIANGLAAAHEKGITHRDLKPENVFITPDERVKILDFGLAKPGRPLGVSRDESTGALRDTDLRLTEEGSVMGTVGYMSPEQIRGEGVDARSDLFSLGVIFYEMLVGTCPFQGRTTVETMTAILRQEVAFPVHSGVDIPAGMEQLIRICLEKEPLSRFQTTWDLALALQTLRTHSEGPRPLPLQEAQKEVWWRSPALRKGLLGLAAGTLLAFSFSDHSGPTGGSGQTLAEWTPLTVRPGLTATARFLPDGESVIYSSALGTAAPTIHSLRIGQVLPRNLGMEGQVMSINRDGAILFVQSPQRVHPGAAALGTLSELLADGTEARPILERAESADRSGDGRHLVVVRVEAGAQGRVNHLECPPGRSLLTTSGWLYCPRLSPDASRVAVLESQGPDSWVARLRILDLQGRTLFLSEVRDIQSQAWSPNGKEILFTRTSGILEAMDLRGRIRTLLRGPNQIYLYDVASDGRLLVASYQDQTEVFLSTEGRPTQRLSLNAWAARLSTDGRQLLFTGPGPKGGDMTYLQHSEGETLRPIASGKILGASDDLAFALLKRKGELIQVPTGPGSEMTVPLGDLGTVWRAAFLPGGRRIAVVAAAPGLDFSLHVVDPGGGPRVTCPGSQGIRQVVPVGAAELVGDAQDSLLRRFTLDGRPGVLLKGAEPGDIPLRLKAGGDQLFVQEAGRQPGLLRIFAIGLQDGERKLWRTLEFPAPPGLRNAQVLSITPDGKRVAYFTWAQPNDLFAVGGVLAAHK